MQPFFFAGVVKRIGIVMCDGSKMWESWGRWDMIEGNFLCNLSWDSWWRTEDQMNESLERGTYVGTLLACSYGSFLSREYPHLNLTSIPWHSAHHRNDEERSSGNTRFVCELDRVWLENERVRIRLEDERVRIRWKNEGCGRGDKEERLMKKKQLEGWRTSGLILVPWWSCYTVTSTLAHKKAETVLLSSAWRFVFILIFTVLDCSRFVE